MREDIAKWVEALRSGEYKQAKNALQVGDGYCCLGVYAKLNNISYAVGFEDYDTGSIVEENADAYRTIHNMIGNDDLCKEGMIMNDSGNSFAEIADMIEEYYTKENADD